MHFPVGFHNKNDNPFPLDPKNKEAHFDELDYMVTYEAMENLIKNGQETDYNNLSLWELQFFS